MNCNKSKMKHHYGGIIHNHYYCCCCGKEGLNEQNDDFAIPPGFINYFAGDTPPVGWLKADGAEVFRNDYADLFEAIGTIYGEGDGETTFKLPDLRGIFIRSWDDGRKVDEGRAFGSEQRGTNVCVGDPTKNSSASSPLSFYNPLNTDILSFRKALGGETPEPIDKTKVVVSYTMTNTLSEASAESCAMTTRPRNIALLACIKY